MISEILQVILELLVGIFQIALLCTFGPPALAFLVLAYLISVALGVSFTAAAIGLAIVIIIIWFFSR